MHNALVNEAAGLQLQTCIFLGFVPRSLSAWVFAESGIAIRACYILLQMVDAIVEEVKIQLKTITKDLGKFL